MSDRSEGPVVGPWPTNPVVHEVFTWVWLADLAASAGRPVTLADVPDSVWDDIARPGIDAVWLMGVWERSPEGARIASTHAAMRGDADRARSTAGRSRGRSTAAASAGANHGAVSERVRWTVVDDVDSSGIGVPFGGWVGSRSVHVHVPRPRPGWRRPAAADLRVP
mgnify:CR=1 FL=1